ncbi:ABC transporter permease [Oceanotoga sp. DSM 15011]|uniref:ABC transporter permease n=1 Tax=Oceanotoga TaxID=1255275 RepID=UPI0021F4653F|nr:MULTISPECIES: ABC transporter permease [Oceanotoga]MDO7976477.1 ABC transporter permease [Oceanotoga teriensis]UYP01310.1 ABC transporter permease [Oceanotoga sp. DSM 15011]
MKYINFLIQEIKNVFKINFIRYKMYTFTNFAITYLIFAGIFNGINGLNNRPLNNIEQTLYIMGYMMWMYTMSGINHPANEILYMRQSGILERLYLGNFSFITVLNTNIIANIINQSIKVFTIGLIGFLSLKPNISVEIILKSILIFIPTIMGVYGIGIMSSALVLKFKRIGQLNQLLSYALLFISGIFIPFSKLPLTIQIISKSFTLGQGVELIQSLIINDKTNVFLSQDYLLLWIIAIFWIFFGIITFLIIEKSAKKKGSLVGY